MARRRRRGHLGVVPGAEARGELVLEVVGGVHGPQQGLHLHRELRRLRATVHTERWKLFVTGAAGQNVTGGGTPDNPRTPPPVCEMRD